MIKYQENGDGIIRKVEIEVTDRGKQDLENGIQCLKKYIGEKYHDVFVEDKENNKLVYQTEVLVPQTTKERPNLLLVIGNPAVHSVGEKMFFPMRESAKIQSGWSTGFGKL